MSDMKLDPGYVRFVNKTPILNSLLYDLDLLPEQLMSQEEITPGLKKAFHDFHLIVGHFKMSAQQWQPIETAPRDGTKIEAWHTVHGLMTVEYSVVAANVIQKDCPWIMGCKTNCWPNRAFSHWRLPTQPPEEK